MDWRAEIRAEFARLGKPADEDVTEELAQHAAAAWTAERAEGSTADRADAAVRELIHAWCLGAADIARPRRTPLLESAPAARSPFAGLGLDIRHSLRLLRRQPGFSVVSVLMIALGIASTTAIFSVVNGVLLKPLPWRDAGRLIRIVESRDGGNLRLPIFSNASYLAWKEHAETVEGLGAYITSTVSFDGSAGLERIASAGVSASAFPLLGVQPILGTVFADADELAPNNIIVSYGFWQERFAGARDVIGKTLMLDGRPRTIIGVMPDGFDFPSRGVRLWTPFRVVPAIVPGSKQTSISMFAAFARLKPGVTPSQAAAEGGARGTAGPDLGMVTSAVFGATGPVRVTAQPMLDSIVGDMKDALWVLLAAVALLCVAAIGNVANMQLAQANARRREMAMRAAIGAGGGRLARQLFVETGVMALIGGVLGLGLTAAILRALPSLLPGDFPRAADVGIDARVALVVVALTILVALIVGLMPVRMARRVRLTSAIAENGSAPVGHRLRSPAARSRALIIAGQVAIAAVLLVGASLLIRSFQTMASADRGFAPSNLMTSRVTLLGQKLSPSARAEFFSTVAAKLRALPGVTTVGYSDVLPLGGTFTRVSFNRTSGEAPGDPNNNISAASRTVSANYASALGLRILQGRGFNESDTATSEPVMLVNEAFVRRYITGDPLAVSLPAGFDSAVEARNPWRIVGVVADVRNQSADEPPQPEVYCSVHQLSDGPSATQYVAVRTTGDSAPVAARLRDIVRETSSRAVAEQIMTMDARLMTSLSRPRLYAVLLGGFALFAALVAVIGLFGGLSYSVSQRTREIGVRTALGATPSEIMRLVVAQGMVMTVLGLVTGLLAAAFATRLLGQFLFGVTAHDPFSFAVVAIGLAAVAALACALPARRAARVDPLKGLRS